MGAALLLHSGLHADRPGIGRPRPAARPGRRRTFWVESYGPV